MTLTYQYAAETYATVRAFSVINYADSLQLPFDKAPTAVNSALELVTTRAKLNGIDPCFNEILSAGYLEGQKMSVSHAHLLSSFC